MFTKCNCKQFIKLKNRILAEVGTVQMKVTQYRYSVLAPKCIAVPVLDTIFEKYRGTGTLKKSIKVANKFF